MITLAREYTDTKNITHKVEHHVIASDGKNSREQILEDLLNALVKPKKHGPA